MSNSVDFGDLQRLFDEFRRDEAAIRPTVHTPHGDAQAWRLSEETGSPCVVSAG
ncbi:hypothetical protein AB0I68_07665 [Streptomyces sp. NPDC050448]|uniref:hypothetical protein n=1 Tax=Streptomyces sp. NPDC050448 TaxID=3155404 RepID=UPI0034179DF0